MKHLGLFAAGVLFGTAGLKILSSKEAKTVYAHTTAAVLRAKDCVMQTVTTIREGAGDIYADAKSINDRRAAEAEPETIEDASADVLYIRPAQALHVHAAIWRSYLFAFTRRSTLPSSISLSISSPKSVFCHANQGRV